MKHTFNRILSDLNNALSHAKGEPMTDFTYDKHINLVSSMEEIEEDRNEALNVELIELATDEWQEANRDEEPDDDEMDKIATNYLEKNKDALLAKFMSYSQSGTYNCHEALDRTSQLIDPVEKLMHCDSIIANPDYYALAYQAHEALYNLYQAIGYHHLDDIPDGIVKLIEAKKNLKK